MALTKVQYTDGVTVIGAKNLNDIQDEVIANGNNVAALSNSKVDKVQGKGLSTNDFTTDNLQKLNGIEAGATRVLVDTALNASSANPVQNKEIYGKMTSTAEADAKYHLGFYLDANGDLCQVDDE